MPIIYVYIIGYIVLGIATTAYIVWANGMPDNENELAKCCVLWPFVASIILARALLSLFEALVYFFRKRK